MQTFKLTLEYDGSKFSGWQDQVNARTVQGELKLAAAELFRTEVEIQGAGRTDASASRERRRERVPSREGTHVV